RAPPRHVFGLGGLPNALNFLLVAFAVTCGALFGLLQTDTHVAHRRIASSPIQSQIEIFSPFLQRLISVSSQVTLVLSTLFFSFSFSYLLFHCSAVSSMFSVTVFLMVLALVTQKVDLVSASLKDEGEQQMTMVVRQFPPRESCRILVILLSLYGT
uniref:Uncharacterized protein n=1 Tax=Hippocampus comes TaxID=109280 RepID=A0A3Q3DED7_HIPCM